MNAPARILLVEDQENDAALVVRELRRSGLEFVWERVDTRVGLEQALARELWDLILADYDLPSLDAPTALALVRALDAHVGFVVVSGTIGEEIAVEMMRCGAQDYVLKDRLARLGEVARREVAETAVRRERARAVEALTDSEARNAAILQAALDAVITMDERGRILDLNPAAERMFGYTRAEVEGRELAEVVVPPELREADREGMRRYLVAGGGGLVGRVAELTARRRDGSVFPVEVAIAPIRSANGPTFTGFVRDISTRKRLETRQRLLAEAGALQVRSLERAEALLQPIADLLVRELATRCGIDLLEADGRVARVAEARRHDLGGDAVLGGPSLEVPMVARDQPLGTIAVERAPRDAPFAPDEIDLLQELAGRCAMAVENVRLYREVRESLRARDEFITIAAHELRTPLTPLRIAAESLASKVRTTGDETEQLSKAVDRILLASQRLGALVERLLDFSDATVGPLRLERAEQDLVVLAREVVAELEGEMERQGCRVVWDVPGSRVTGSWDPRRLRLALRDLLTNALKFAPGAPIEVRVCADDDDAQVVVRDHGPGLPAVERSRLFERYERNGPVRHHGGGFGLGLWLVRRVIDDHGGRVDVWSEPGQGARFTLTLPRRPVLDARDGSS